MGKCIKCGNDTNNEAIYGIIERYHYDTRTYSTDTDYGATTFSPIGIVKLSYCDECLKKASKKLRINAFKSIGICLLIIIVMAAVGETAGDFGGIALFVCLIGLIVALVSLVKSFLFKNKMIGAADGKISKENVLISERDGDLDVERIEGTLNNRHDYSYRFIDAKKLSQPIKENAKSSYQVALNQLKTWYQQIDKTPITKTKSINVDKKKIEPVVSKKVEKENDVLNEKKVEPEVKKQNEVLQKTKEIADKAKEKIKNIKMPKLNKKIGLICLGIVAVAGLIIGIISFKNSSYINLNDYVTYNIEGFEGEGRIHLNIDYERLLNDYDGKLEYDTFPEFSLDEEPTDIQFLYEDIASCDYALDIPFLSMGFYDVEPNSGISNGDTIKIIPNDDIAILNDMFKNKFKASQMTITVQGLTTVTTVNLFENIDESCVRYEGPDGYAYGFVDMKDLIGKTIINTGNITGTVYKDDYDRRYKLRVCEDGFEVCSPCFTLSQSTDLHNDDLIFLELDDPQVLSEYGVVLEANGLALKVKGLPELITSGEQITKEMIGSFLNEQMVKVHEGYTIFTGSNSQELSIFFKMPDELETNEAVIITVDFNRHCSYKDDYGTMEHDDGKYFATIYNPCIVDGELSCSRYEENLAEEYYAPIEEEYALVNEQVTVNNYGEYLLLLASDKTQKLIDAGYEDADYINAVLACFINDSLHVIYEQ